MATTNFSFAAGAANGGGSGTAQIIDPPTLSGSTTFEFPTATVTGASGAEDLIRMTIQSKSGNFKIDANYFPNQNLYYSAPGGSTTVPFGGYQIQAGNGGITAFYGTAADLQSLIRNLSFEYSGSSAKVTTAFVFQYWSGVSLTQAGPTGSPAVGSVFSNGQFTSSSSSPSTTGPFQVTACYRRGTMIATPRGFVAVEDLRVGDPVDTLGGAGPQPVKWIGYRSHDAVDVATYPSLRPVLITAGALDDGVPARDLFVSPMHGMLLDDVIVPAASLVNGRSISRVDAAAQVDYFHVELEAHDFVLAEGAAGETFIDNASRQVFDNAHEFYLLHGANTGTTPPAAARIEEGYVLEAIHRRLAGGGAYRAPRGQAPSAAEAPCPELHGAVERITDGVLEGWAFDGGPAVELEILVDGEPVARLLANRFRTDLDDAGIGGGRAGFTAALPASAVALSQIEVRRRRDGGALRHLASESADS